MLIILLILSIAMIVVGWIFCDNSGDEGWLAMIVLGTIATIGAVVAMIVGFVKIAEEPIYEDKIAMYEEENAKIEESVKSVIETYTEYEKDVYESVNISNLDGEKLILLTSIYPDLKADELVQQQIALYVENNNQIKTLKNDKLNIRVWKTILYFGK